MTPCKCENDTCSCMPYCTPIRAVFDDQGYKEQVLLHTIKQNKGEAEMSQIDWLMEYSSLVKKNESCVSIVSSGDIDAVVLHLFAVSYKWPRQEDDTFANNVFVLLRKPNQQYDIYNITRIVETLEKFTDEKYFGMKTAMVLSLGGNDFLPKFYNITHSSTLEMFMRGTVFRKELVNISIHEDNTFASISFSSDIYIDFIKHLYCPKMYEGEKLSYDEVRQMSIKQPTGKCLQRNAQLWMPQKIIIQKLAMNVKCLLQYQITIRRDRIRIWR